MTIAGDTDLATTEQLNKIWQSGEFSTITAPDGVQLAYCSFVHPQAKANLVISAGRCESYLKYQELIIQLYQMGCNVFVLDHRGQGLSERQLKNAHKGYVKHFDDYAKDLDLFVTKIVKVHSNKKLKLILLAHSMGGAIGIRLMQLKPLLFTSALLSSPMIAINTGSVPFKLALPIAKTLRFINQLLDNEPWYFLGQSNYQEKPFENNPLMADSDRYTNFIQLYRTQLQLQLGGVTIQWLVEALENTARIMADLGKIKTKIILLQAEMDNIVENKAQNVFCQRLHRLQPSLISKRPQVISQAKHEILFETDNLRNTALEQLSQLIND